MNMSCKTSLNCCIDASDVHTSKKYKFNKCKLVIFKDSKTNKKLNSKPYVTEIPNKGNPKKSRSGSRTNIG